MHCRDRPPKSQTGSDERRARGGTTSPRGRYVLHKLSGGSRGALGDAQTFRGWASNLHVNQNFSLALRANAFARAAHASAWYLRILFMVRTWRVPFSACMGSRQVGRKAFESGKRVFSARRGCSSRRAFSASAFYRRGALVSKVENVSALRAQERKNTKRAWAPSLRSLAAYALARF